MSRRAIARPAIRRTVVRGLPRLERLAFLPDAAISTRSGKRFGGMGGLASGSRGEAGVPLEPAPAARQAALISMILNLILLPRGVCTSTVSPFLWPRIARPTGDSFESRRSAGLASAEPTM